MRYLVAIGVFVGSLAVLAVACTWGWDSFISGRLYDCTDSVPLDFLHPGDWVHHPVAVQQVVTPRSMSEPDTIKAGWSITGLWLLWCSLVAGSVIISLLLARLPWSIRRRREQIYAHTNAA